MEFFCWFLFPVAAVQEERRKYAQLRAQKKEPGSCASQKERACWVAGLLATLAGLCWLGFAGCGPAGFASCGGWACWLGLLAALIFVSFQQLVCCYCPLSCLYLSSLLLYSTGSFQATLFPLYSRLACELIKALLELQFVWWLERIIWALWASVACGPLISFLFILFSP